MPRLEDLTPVMDEYMTAVVYPDFVPQDSPHENYQLRSLEDLKYLEEETPPD